MERISLPRRPLLKPWYRKAQEGDKLALAYGESILTLEGRAVTQLLPALMSRLDGRRTVEELVAELGEPAAPAVEHALALLARHGALIEGPGPAPELSRAHADTVEHLVAGAGPGTTLAGVADALAEARVGVAGSGAVAEEVRRLALLSGVARLEPIGWSGEASLDRGLALVIAAPSPVELPLLEELNLRTWRARVPWLQVLPFDGRFAAVGPLYVPGETCCHRCFLHRRAANVDWGDEFWALARTAASYPTPPAMTAAIAGLAVTLGLRWLAHRDPFLPGVLHALEEESSIRLSAHVVYRVPRCAVCSGLAELAAPAPWCEGGDVR